MVWPVTALYFGPIALWAYWVMGRPQTKQRRSAKTEQHRYAQQNQQEKKGNDPSWETTFVGVTHCGSGCTLGDIAGEWIVFWLGLTLAGFVL